MIIVSLFVYDESVGTLPPGWFRDRPFELDQSAFFLTFHDGG